MNRLLLIILLDPDTYIYIGWAVLTLLSLLLAWLFFRRRHSSHLVPRTSHLVPRTSHLVPRTSLFLLALAWAVFLYGTYIGFSQLEVRHIELAFDDLPPSFDGYKIVQFSDVHAGTMTGRRRHLLEEAIDSINAQQADMVVFTGDLQNIVPEEIEPVADLLSSVKARDGVFSVLGNHDYPMYFKGDEFEKYEKMGLRMNIDEQLGWTLLVNERRFIRRGNERIVIGGMDNDGATERFPQNGDVQQTLFGVRLHDFIVMLEHDPTAWRRKILPHSHTQLTLSGHTHGGQVSLFGWTPASITYHESRGLYQAGKRYLYVNSGLGGVVPFRLGTPAEIVVITLRRNEIMKE